MEKLDVTKPCRLRSGETLTYLTTLKDGYCRNLVFKYMDETGHETLACTYKDGSFYGDSVPSPWDAINVAEQREAWALVVLNSTRQESKSVVGVFASLELAQVARDVHKHYNSKKEYIIDHLTWEE